MTPYEWIGYCVAWAVAIACAALPFIAGSWAIDRMVSHTGLFILWIDFIRYERDGALSKQMLLHGWRWWRWEKVVTVDEVVVVESWDDEQETEL